MTREEAAYKIAHAFYDSASDRWDIVKMRGEKLVDAFVALGLLKLEEKKVGATLPKFEAIRISRCSTTETSAFCDMLEAFGYKIVEKQHGE